ncbi:cysteine dioxygenase family protein [Streptomyces sp. RB6PN25]|uniref:Cysteine dioxygenase family protein n=1 Tax=Streptomyces humicola TaxID=2953240 RepID=A0ABT1PT37_9ACTN|nr:cysteine dioxygenase family protein [Streptomyces humicola]MCQ4080837.1 cysteine dioxygenase family protein [Streptomyces humicola]
MSIASPSIGASLPHAAALSPAQLADLADRFAERRGLWLPHVRYQSPDRYYTRLELSQTYEVWLLTWLPGQGTEIHGHGGSNGAFTVIRGELTERTFPPTSYPVHPTPRRLRADEVRAFGPRHVHQVTNEATAPAVSVHAYSPPLATMSYYRQLPDGRLMTERIDGVAE